MRKLRLAIVGCGSITERGLIPHLLLEQDKVEIVALCDISKDRSEEIAQKFDLANATTFTTLEEMLENSDAEAVAIATPIPYHFDQAHTCLSSGRHVYVQKTMTHSSEEARALIRIAHDKGLKIAASPGQMLLPAYMHARELIEEGVLGTVYVAIGVNMSRGHEHEALRSKTRKTALDPIWYYKEGAGPLRDMGVYSLHAICGILGRAKKVSAFATRPMEERYWNGKRIPVEINDNFTLSLELDRQRLATVCTTFSANPTILRWGHLTISGSEGSLEVRRLLSNSARYELLLHLGNETKPTRREFGTGLSEEHEMLEEAHVARDLLDFADAVLDNRPPLASAEDALHVIEIIEAAEKASETSSVVDILNREGRAGC